MNYFLGVDFGGGASKATLLGENGKIIATNSVEYPTYYPKQGYAEQNPMDWYKATKTNIKQVISKSGVNPKDIVCLCLDAATHTAVLCDENGTVLRNAIYWTDTRSVNEVTYLKENFGDLIIEKALHGVDTIWTLPQLLWIKNNEPEIWGKISKIMFAKDFVRHLLTGDNVTDYIEAQGSMLFDYHTRSWSKQLCNILALDIRKLPEIVRPLDIVGRITESAAKDTGLNKGTTVICGTTDTAMEIFASGAVEKKAMTIKLATAGRICVVTDKAIPNYHLINYSHVKDGLWYPGTATKSCAASYRWYRDTFGEEYKQLDEDAKDIPVGAEGLLFHPYLSGELTPYADPKLKGSFIGITAGHTKAHFSRAVLEGVAFSLLECKNEIEKIGIPHSDSATIIGGGSLSSLWRQIVSDVLEITLIQHENSDSSLGSAMLAAIAAGAFENEKDAIEKCTSIVSTTVPNTENTQKYKKLFEAYKAVHDALAPIYRAEK